MMTKILTVATTAFILALPNAVLASDGGMSPDEFATTHPDAEEGTFEKVDTDHNGELSVDEISEARQAGILPEN